MNKRGSPSCARFLAREVGRGKSFLLLLSNFKKVGRRFRSVVEELDVDVDDTRSIPGAAVVGWSWPLLLLLCPTVSLAGSLQDTSNITRP